jgi:hypothetical protein
MRVANQTDLLAAARRHSVPVCPLLRGAAQKVHLRVPASSESATWFSARATWYLESNAALRVGCRKSVVIHVCSVASDEALCQVPRTPFPVSHQVHSRFVTRAPAWLAPASAGTCTPKGDKEERNPPESPVQVKRHYSWQSLSHATWHSARHASSWRSRQVNTEPLARTSCCSY